MDHEAVTKCAEYRLPIQVLNFRKPGNVRRAIRGQRVGTQIKRSVDKGK
jgi:uridylate kinase